MQLKTARPLLDRLHFSCLGLAKSLCEISKWWQRKRRDGYGVQVYFYRQGT